MDDESYEPEQPQARTIEVIPYSVYRDEVRDAADDASAAAVAGVMDRVDANADALSAAVDDVAGAAADAAATKVVAAMRDAAQDGEGDSSEPVTYVVQLEQSQYDALLLAGRRQLGASFLCVCLLAALVGVQLWAVVSREFR